ncbi:MAG: Gfo/Idh/MocA family oxidoreductase [Acidobacteria bacterium]|nr:Gfo/Idh/MocA family oxidoreductase [Acidobacteriota bacterium]
MRFGLIGAGEIGALRARALGRLSGSSLVVAADRDRDRALRLAPETADDAREVYSRDDVDAVLICTPPNLHEEQAVAALDAGKHVLCEKPLAPSPEAARRMVEAARRNGRMLATGFNQRYFPNLRRAKESIEQGQIGRVLHVRAYAGHRGLSEFRNASERDPGVIGGGALMDNGIHLIDHVRYLGGEFDSVSGFASEAMWKIPGAEDNGVALLSAADGRWASLQASWTEWRGYRFWIQVYGEKGAVSASYGPLYFELEQVDGEGRRVHRERALYPGANVREKIQGWQSTVELAFVDELSDFVRRAAGERGPAATGFDGFRAVEIAHAVRRSSASRSPVALSDPF